MTSSSQRKPDRGNSEENTPQKKGDDTLFHFADKTAGFVSAMGLGYLVLHALPAAMWIAVVCLVLGLGAKVFCRAL